MFITRNNTKYELTANEMFEVFCAYEFMCDARFVETEYQYDEPFVNNSEIANKLIFREIALDMRSLVEQGDLNKQEALRTAKEKYLERISDSGLSIIDFLKEELCREVGSHVGTYKRINNEYILEDGQTRVTFTNPTALLDCYLPFLRTAQSNYAPWDWAMQFVEENR